jgi:heat shock protein HslJ
MGMRTDRRATRHVGIAAVAVMAIALGACGDDSDPAGGATVPPVTTPAAEPTTPIGAWRLSSATVDGAPIDATADEIAKATLVVEDGTVGGTAFCNSYGGDATFAPDGTLAIAGLSMTEMACEPSHLMELEQIFAAHLVSATAWSVDGDTLTVTGPDADWVFAREAPVEPAALVGTEWVLDTLIEGDAASNAPGMESATLVFGDDGSLSGSTGCRTFTGRWSQQGATIVVPELALDGTCPADEEALDSAVVGVLERMTVEIDGPRLTLTAEDGTGLSYRAG